MPDHTQYWPSWHPDHELTALDLRLLESYILSAHTLFDPSYGIHTFDLPESLQCEFKADKASVRLSNLRALTGSGHPIVLQAGQVIVADLIVDSRSDVVVDLNVEVNAASKPEVMPSDQPDKLSLQPVLVNSDTLVNEPAPNVLFLGRYRFFRNASMKPELVVRPMVLRLSALQTSDPQWNEWTAPLSNRIGDLILEFAAQPNVTGMVMAAFAEASWLSAAWPLLSIHQLVFRLRLLNSLLGCRPGNVPAMVSDEIFQRSVRTADQLPVLLARLLDVESSCPRVGERIELIVARYVDVSVAPNSIDARLLSELPAGTWELALLRDPRPKVMRAFYKSDVDFKLMRAKQNGAEILYSIGQMPLLKAGNHMKLAADVLKVKKEDIRIYFTRTA